MDGHGKFGSVTGDLPAACVILSPAFCLRDMILPRHRGWANFDESLQQPMTCRFPTLVNGAEVLVVGMARRSPQFGGMYRCFAYLIEHPGATVDELMQFVGPDFPTDILGTRGSGLYHRPGQD